MNGSISKEIFQLHCVSFKMTKKLRALCVYSQRSLWLSYQLANVF